MNPTWSSAEQKRLFQLYQAGHSWFECATIINDEFHTGENVRSRAGARKHHQTFYKGPKRTATFGARADGPTAPPSQPQPDMQVRQTERDLDIMLLRADIRTLEDLVAYAQVDLTKWECTSFECNKWDMGSLDTVGKPQTTPLYQAKAKFRPIAATIARLDVLRSDLLADIREESRLWTPDFGTIYTTHEDVLLELGLPDLHLGKYAWEDETGNNYNTEIATDLFKSAFETLLARASGFSPGKVLLPIGNDFFHIDNRQNQTTAGTPQDADTRYFRLIRRGRQLYSWAIKRCIEEVGPVQCVIVPGNHDLISTTFLGEILSAQFDANPHVGLDDSLYPRKYVQHGNVLLGFCHGNTEKNTDLPMLMAKEQKHAWAQCTHHEWHIGHLHKSKETRYTAGDSHHGGVRVRILPSLSGTDYWHATKGYTGETRAAEAYLWSAGSGYLGHLNFSAQVEKEIACIKL